MSKPVETEEDLIINEILGWERWCDGGHVTRDEIKRMMKQQKPTVTRAWVNVEAAEIMGVINDLAPKVGVLQILREAIPELLKDAGVKVAK